MRDTIMVLGFLVVMVAASSWGSWVHRSYRRRVGGGGGGVVPRWLGVMEKTRAYLAGEAFDESWQARR